jgi:hypothetical protein
MRTLFQSAAALSFLGLAACATPVEIAPIGLQALSVESNPAQREAFARVTPHITYTGWEEVDMILPAEGG